MKGIYLIVHISSLKIHLNNNIREGYLYKVGMANIPVDGNQGNPPKGDPCDFTLFGNIGTPFMATLNILGLNVGLLVWLWSTLNILNVIEAYKMNTLF